MNKNDGKPAQRNPQDHPLNGRKEISSSSDKEPLSPSISPSSAASSSLSDSSLYDLVLRFKDGDVTAFDELAPHLGRMAYNLALKSVSDPNVAEDISQEALLRLYVHVSEIEGVNAFKTWFYRVVLNLVHDYFRGSSRKGNAHAALEEIRGLEDRSRREPLSDLDRQYLRQALNCALGELDERHREVFLMKEVENLAHSEIAKHLGIPEGTVWSRLSYARKKLQEKLRRMGYEG